MHGSDAVSDSDPVGYKILREKNDIKELTLALSVFCLLIWR